MASSHNELLSRIGLHIGGQTTSGTWPSANRAVYVPIVLQTACVLRRFWWANGSTVSASYNIDCGIYQESGYAPGVKIISTGSTAQGTASQVQFVDVTDTALPSGRYWLALSASSASATIFRASVSGLLNAAVLYIEESALPLPSTATPATAGPHQYLPLFGFATTASP